MYSRYGESERARNESRDYDRFNSRTNSSKNRLFSVFTLAHTHEHNASRTFDVRFDSSLLLPLVHLSFTINTEVIRVASKIIDSMLFASFKFVRYSTSFIAEIEYAIKRELNRAE